MFDSRIPETGCGFGRVLEVLVPGMQGIPGSTTAVNYDPQELTPEQQEQARKNIGAAAAELVETAITQGFALRFCPSELTPGASGLSIDLLNPQKGVKAGDSVIDGSRRLFQIVSINEEAHTFRLTNVLAQLGVLSYDELSDKPKLGRLAGLDEVSESELTSSINLGSL